eukprot:scaffold10301_cov121-Isochrysis_galbana.AAC.6
MPDSVQNVQSLPSMCIQSTSRCARAEPRPRPSTSGRKPTARSSATGAKSAWSRVSRTTDSYVLPGNFLASAWNQTSPPNPTTSPPNAAIPPVRRSRDGQSVPVAPSQPRPHSMVCASTSPTAAAAEPVMTAARIGRCRSMRACARNGSGMHSAAGLVSLSARRLSVVTSCQPRRG